MTPIKFQRIFDKHSDEAEWKGDNAFKGLQIIARYINQEKRDLIVGADHGVIYSVDLVKICRAGITEEDIIALAHLNWYIEDDEFLACPV